MQMKKPVIAVLSTAILAGGVIAAAVTGPAAGQGYDDPGTTSSTPATPTTMMTTASTIKIGHSKLGHYLVNGSGRTLYLFEKDTGKTSKCSGACAKEWPPVLTGAAPKAGSGVKKALLGTTKRADGTLQVTYNGHPLYRYDDDKASGQHHGQGLKEYGAKWYVVRSNGKKLDND